MPIGKVGEVVLEGGSGSRRDGGPRSVLALRPVEEARGGRVAVDADEAVGAAARSEAGGVDRGQGVAACCSGRAVGSNMKSKCFYRHQW